MTHRQRATAGLLVVATALVAACGESSAPKSGGGKTRPSAGSTPSAATNAVKKTWTTDEMAADPEGYLVWADQQLAAQVELREQRVAEVTKRHDELLQRRASFGANFDDLVNVEKRLSTAVRKADEEDRWPVKMGGHLFDRAKADSVLAELRRHVEQRRPLVQTYDDGLAKLDTMAATLKGDAERLTTLRDKLAVDLEQVRVSHGVAELEKLRTTEAEIAHYSQILGSIAEDQSGAMPNSPPPVDLDKMLEGTK